MEEAAHYFMREHAPGDYPCIVELGCGMGRFACETAAARSGAFIIGIEREQNAIIIGMERAMRESLQNIRFIPEDVCKLADFFKAGSIDELYIHFCDPWPHRKQAPRRLVSRGFLQLYRPLLAPGGFLRFKTDNAPLFEFAQMELAAEGWTVTHCDADSPPEGIITDYEMKFRGLGVAICALTANK
jgi:tRNA (guanine-N7-)-methyltransferase